jgi:hypothetical protein
MPQDSQETPPCRTAVKALQTECDQADRCKQTDRRLDGHALDPAVVAVILLRWRSHRRAAHTERPDDQAGRGLQPHVAQEQRALDVVVDRRLQEDRVPD